ncbi:hypothetical protein VP395_15195 [Mariniflexile soesokkakense]|uniref:Lipoprotein n=1 Tax=Mariniflexile soesokkakense TaxID=1343160 RepID=A0ABV0AFS6_9FLAO
MNTRKYIWLIIILSLVSCNFDHPRKSDKINADFILKINESELKDFDSINRLLIYNKTDLVPRLEKDNPVPFGKVTNHYFTKVLLNKYLPDSTINKGFLKRHNFSVNPENTIKTKPNLNLFYLHFNFETNKATYTLWNSKTIRGERSSTEPEKNFNYSIEQKLLFNYNCDTIQKERNNLLYTKKINNDWIYVIDYIKVGDDDYYKATIKETEYLKEKYFNFDKKESIK